MNYFRVHLHAKDADDRNVRLYYVVKAETAEDADEKALNTAFCCGFTGGLVLYNQKLLDTGVYLCAVKDAD